MIIIISKWMITSVKIRKYQTAKFIMDFQIEKILSVKGLFDL